MLPTSVKTAVDMIANPCSFKAFKQGPLEKDTMTCNRLGRASKQLDLVDTNR